MTEQQLQDAIVECARLYQWRVAHFRPARTQKGWRTPAQYDGKGYPDLTLVRDRVVFAEIKQVKFRLAVEQQEWRDALQLAGAEWHLWTPAEWEAGDVEAVLRRAA